MTQDLAVLKETPSQTAGPYVHIGLTPGAAGIGDRTDLGRTLIRGAVQGERIVVTGEIRDGLGAILRDALVEIWQADSAGRYPGTEGADPGFAGWGRAALDTGTFIFETVKPGRVPAPDGRLQAPHITLWIVARGINIGLHTRIYFADEADANAEDPILSKIEHKVRIPTLLAKPEGEGHYRFDVCLQGPDETIFFDM